MAEKLDLDALERSNLGKTVRPEDWIALLAYARRVERDANRWAIFERALYNGHLPGAAYGRRFKIIETCPMSGDEKEFNDFIGTIDAAAEIGRKKGEGE